MSEKIPLEKIGTFGKLAVYAICGHRYPTGSIKYRVAERLIAEAEQSGQLHPGAGIVEVSSGNTGQALAFLGRERGYPVTIICPMDVTPAAKVRIKSYGATLREVDGWYAQCHQ